MARRGALRGALTAWLGLVALQVATTDRGAGSLAGGLDGVRGLIERAFSPDVPALPDFAHRTGRDEEPDDPTPATTTTKTEASAVPDPRTIPVPHGR